MDEYNFSPYLEKLISKGRNKAPRVISIPTIKDRIVLYALKEVLHELFPECVNTELVNKKIKDIFSYLGVSGETKIIRLDIKDFYGSINQKILFDKINKCCFNSYCGSIKN